MKSFLCSHFSRGKLHKKTPDLSWQSDCAMWLLFLEVVRGRLSRGLGSVVFFLFLNSFVRDRWWWGRQGLSPSGHTNGIEIDAFAPNKCDFWLTKNPLIRQCLVWSKPLASIPAYRASEHQKHSLNSSYIHSSCCWFPPLLVRGWLFFFVFTFLFCFDSASPEASNYVAYFTPVARFNFQRCA